MTAAVHTPAFRKPNATRMARRLREIADGLRTDLGHVPDTGEAALIDLTAALILHRENLSAAMLRGEPVKSAEITKISGAVTRGLGALRSKGRKAPDAPTIRERLAASA